MNKINKYKKDVEIYYKKFTDGGFGSSKLTFYDKNKTKNLPEELKNSSLACGNPIKYLNKSSMPDNCKIFDLGCGGGFELSLIHKNFSPYLAIGLDYSEGMIKKCGKNIQKFCDKNTFCLRGDGEFLPFKDNSFDICVSNAAINLIPDKNRVFSEIRRILKPSGRLIFSDVTILTPIPDKIREKFTVMDGLYFAPTIMKYEEELKLIKKYFEEVSVLDKINILPDEKHSEFLVSNLKTLSKKDRKFYKKSLMKGKYRVIEVEALVKVRGNIDKIKCNCGNILSVETFQVIDIEKSPSLFSRFVNDDLNFFDCDQCKTKVSLPVPVMILWDKYNIKATIFPKMLESKKDFFSAQLPKNEKIYFSSKNLLKDFPLLKNLS